MKTEIKSITRRIVQLDKLMDEALDSPTAWKRTLGCPGSRYLPEWEKLMAKLTKWFSQKTTSKSDIDEQYEYEQKLRA
jgi:hypothetical protein